MDSLLVRAVGRRVVRFRQARSSPGSGSDPGKSGGSAAFASRFASDHRRPYRRQGHSDAYNQPLSEKRAEAARDWLVKNCGASAARITTKGWGKTKPIVPNTHPDGSDDPDGRKKNPRVEITVRTG